MGKAALGLCSLNLIGIARGCKEDADLSSIQQACIFQDLYPA
jgi:hypothetical protein